MASADGSNFNKQKDLRTDDPSILGFSSSYPGTSKLHKTMSRPAQYSAGHHHGQENQRNSNQQSQKPQTPSSSERRQKEHWKVPPNGRNGPLARDLFGAPNNPDFRFDSQGERGHGGQKYHNSGNNQEGNFHHKKQNTQSGGRGSKDQAKVRPKTNHDPQRYAYDVRRQGHDPQRQGHDPRRQGHDPREHSQNAKSAREAQQSKGRQEPPKPNHGTGTGATNGGTEATKTRNTQYLETLMKNGQKSNELRVTVPNKPGGKRLVDAPGNSSQVAALLTTDPKKPVEQSSSRTKSESDSQSAENRQNDMTGPNGAMEEGVAAERKKRKRRERKKKKERKAQEKHGQSDQDSRPTSRASTERRKESLDEQKSAADKAIAKRSPEAESAGAKEAGGTPQKNTSVYVNPLLAEEKKNEVKEEKEDAKDEKASTDAKDEAAKKLEELGLKQAEKRLEKDMIFKLEKKSPGFPDAVYFCQLCSHHLNTIQLAHKHIKDKRHKKEFKNKQQDELLKRLKRPPEEAIESLEHLLQEVITEKMLSQEDAKARREVVEKLGEIVRSQLPDCKVVMYGSSVSMIGMKTSNVNVDIQFPETMKTPAVLLSLLDLLKKCDQYTNVKEDFDAKVPRIEITDGATNIRCSLSACNMKALQTTRLLRVYGQIEPEFVKLSMLLRMWGHLCQVDRQQEGSLPPHSFALMTLFYLQQQQKLPVLHEVMAEHDIESLLEDEGDEHKCLELRDDGWWYVPTAPPSGKKSDHKEAEEEDDTEDVIDYSDSDDDIEVSFRESPKEPSAPDVKKSTDDVSLEPVKLGVCFNGETPSMAELWLDLLKFYSAHFDMENLIITVRSSSRVTRTDRGWSHRRIAVEDPCSPKWNLCKPMNSQALFTYFMTRLKHSVFYFHTAHNSVKNKTDEKKKSANNSAGQERGRVENSERGYVQNERVKTPHELANNILSSALEEVKGHLPHPDEHDDDNEGQISRSDEQQETCSSTSDKSATDIAECISKFADNVVDDIMESLKRMSLKEGKEESAIRPETVDSNTEESESKISYNACYKFTKAALMDGKAPVTVCCLCKREGHTKKNCPDEIKVKVEPLPPLTERLKLMLDAVCKEMYEMYVPKEDEVAMRERVCSGLLEYLRQNYNKDVKLCLFGSSRNRFTFRGSDLDICMTFEGNETGEGVDFVQVIEDLAKVLRKDPALRYIIPITTAKVPIVKFFHPMSNLEGDISLYNLLAQRNTAMLALYATIDDRCRVLGYAMKAFVKRCCIGDASRGSLSSYAYTLLVIYFLQQRNPPVLPVLQELYKGEKSPEVVVDGWNSWFYDSIGNLGNVWPEFGKNRETLGELWLGMLRFYTEEFNFRQHVASIRQKKILTAFEKEWTSKCICIEDPFDLNHNLGAGVSRKMTNFIMSVFIKARERFGTEPKINRLFDYQRYFFDAKILMDGQEVPNDRCCRICGKIGHFVKDCPKRRNGRGKKNGDPEAKLREIECFGCGKKGHYKKDCPEGKQGFGSPAKNAGAFAESPRGPVRPALLPNPPFHLVSAPPAMQKNAPVVVHAKRREPTNMTFPDARTVTKPKQQENKSNKKPQNNNQNRKNRSEQPQLAAHAAELPKGSKTPQGHHSRQQKHSPNQSPFPSGSSPAYQGAQGSNSKVNRNLVADFGKNLIAERNLSHTPQGHPTTSNSSPFHPSPTAPKPLPTSNPSRSSRHGLTLHDTSVAASNKTKKETPSPVMMPTVAEVESQMLRQEEKKRNSKQDNARPAMSQSNARKPPPPSHPQAGDKINHLIPRSGNKEDSRRSVNGGYAAYAHFAHTPPFPMSPPQNLFGPFIPPFSTSPRGNGGQYVPHPSDQPYFRGNSGGPGLKTPPTPPMQPMRSPNGPGFHMSGVTPPGNFGHSYPPPSPQSKFDGRFYGSNNQRPDSVMGEVFVNSKEKQQQHQREVYFTPTVGPTPIPPYYDPHGGSGGMYRSYPPNQTAPNPHWPSPRK